MAVKTARYRCAHCGWEATSTAEHADSGTHWHITHSDLPDNIHLAASSRTLHATLKMLFSSHTDPSGCGSTITRHIGAPQ